jgi:hypothetical protein
MALGLKDTVSNAILNALCRNVTWTQPAAFYIKLHLGDPGTAGTGSPATETTRKLCTFSAASAGSITTSADISWTSYPAAETVSHVSFWDAVSAGTYLGDASLTASQTLAIGNTLTIVAGQLTLSLNTAA